MSIWNATFFSAETIKWPENENYFFYIVSGDKRNEWCDLKQFGTLINFNFFLRGITKFLLFSFATRHDFCLTHRTNMKASFCEKTLEQTKSPFADYRKDNNPRKAHILCFVIFPNKVVQVVDFITDKVWKTHIWTTVAQEKKMPVITMNHTYNCISSKNETVNWAKTRHFTRLFFGCSGEKWNYEWK